ncbi:MAG: insulinase family protein, partial [Candidatus Krumholzibacteria bacterium]|nr:insulinase family protein [Candidatus Krumholzibacteria bacterium]
MRRIFTALISAAMIAAAVPAAAGTRDVKLPDYEEHVMKNGLKVFIVPASEVPLVTMRLLIPAGSYTDKEGDEGLAAMTARLLLNGAGGMGAEEISASVEGVGGRLDAWAGRDYAIVTGDFLSRDFELGLDHLARVVTRPDFPAEEFERERSIVLAEAMSVKENPYALANREFLRLLLAPDPYGNPVDGYPASVRKMSRDDVFFFHKEHYVPEGAILAVVGDVDAGKAKKLIEKKLGGWKSGAPVLVRIVNVNRTEILSRRVIVIDKPDLTQSQIRIGNIAVGRNTPDYFDLKVANSILGGGFTSRLMDEIRVNRGLSYGARSNLSQYRYGGFFGIYTYTNNSTLRETIDVALEQVRLMRDVKVGDEELAGSRRYISGLFPFDIETNADIAQWMTDLEYYSLGGDFVEKYRSRIG